MIKIFQWEWRGQPVFTVFLHTMRKRIRHNWHGRRVVKLIPDECRMIDCTAEEVGQIMGGN